MAEDKFVGDDEEALAILRASAGDEPIIVEEIIATGEEADDGDADEQRDGGDEESEAERT